MGELLLFCCTLILAIIIYLIYNKEKPNYVFFSARKNQDSYHKAIRNKYMRELSEKEYLSNYPSSQPQYQEMNQLKQVYYDNSLNNNANKQSDNFFNSSFKKDYLYFNNNKGKDYVQESQLKEKKSTNGWNDNYDWLIHDNTIKKGVRVIKADEFLSKPLDSSLSTNKNVLLNTTAIQNMFKTKETLRKDSPEVKNVMRKLDFNE